MGDDPDQHGFGTRHGRHRFRHHDDFLHLFQGQGIVLAGHFEGDQGQPFGALLGVLARQQRAAAMRHRPARRGLAELPRQHFFDVEDPGDVLAGGGVCRIDREHAGQFLTRIGGQFALPRFDPGRFGRRQPLHRIDHESGRTGAAQDDRARCVPRFRLRPSEDCRQADDRPPPSPAGSPSPSSPWGSSAGGPPAGRGSLPQRLQPATRSGVRRREMSESAAVHPPTATVTAARHQAFGCPSSSAREAISSIAAARSSAPWACSADALAACREAAVDCSAAAAICRAPWTHLGNRRRGSPRRPAG